LCTGLDGTCAGYSNCYDGIGIFKEKGVLN